MIRQKKNQISQHHAFLEWTPTFSSADCVGYSYTDTDSNYRDSPFWSSGVAILASCQRNAFEQNQPLQVGLCDYEASFLRLIEKIVDGSEIFVNETGTAMQYRPGMISGGRCESLFAFRSDPAEQQ
jgi:hypothetical protein